jgi:hypothetical protein
MIGFLVGSACLLGLARSAGPRGCGAYYQRGDHGWHGHHRHERSEYRTYGEERESYVPRGRGSFMYGLLSKLEATPAQEKVLFGALSELQALRKKSREELKHARRDVAEAFRSPVFSEESVGAATARLEAIVEDARKLGISIFAKAHEVLDERQRRILADMITTELA